MLFANIEAKAQQISLREVEHAYADARANVVALALELQQEFIALRSQIRESLPLNERGKRPFCVLDLRARLRGEYLYIEWSTLQKLPDRSNGGTRPHRGHIEKRRGKAYDVRALCRMVPEDYHPLIEQAERTAARLRGAYLGLRALRAAIDEIASHHIGDLPRATSEAAGEGARVDSVARTAA